MNSVVFSTTAQSLPRFLASKWLSYHILLDVEEWKEFFTLPELQSLYMFKAAGFFERDAICLPQHQFLDMWTVYQDNLIHSERIDDKIIRPFFSLYLTLSQDCVVGVQKNSMSSSLLIQPVQPCMTMQLHRFHVATSPKVKIHSAVFGPHAFSWGVTISYPQIVQDGATKEVRNTFKDSRCQNTQLWRTTQKFIRQKTIPLPLLVHGVPLWSELRLGRKAALWIDNHKELYKERPILQIDTSRIDRVIHSKNFEG